MTIYILQPNRAGGAEAFVVTFMNGTQLLEKVRVLRGKSAVFSLDDPTKPEDADYTYSFVGWNSRDGQESAEAGVLDNIQESKAVYAAYARMHKPVTVTFMNGQEVWDTVTVPYGSTASTSKGNPTKAEDEQYTYSFAGWANSDGQEAGEEGILENVTSNKTVYAAYSKKEKGLTVIWKNNDGTVLATTIVQKGDTPTYSGKTPVFADKENRSAITSLGLSHTGWIPEPSPIETDTTYIANYSFPTGMSETVPKTWDEIINDANMGENADYELLSTKIMQTTDGNLLCFELAGIGVDDLADGSGKAAFTFIAKTIDGKCKWNTSNDNTNGYPSSNYKTYLEGTCLNHFPANIKNAMKSVSKVCRSYSPNTVNMSYTAKIWPPSLHELKYTDDAYYETTGVGYTAYTSHSQRIRYDSSGTGVAAWLSSAYCDNGSDACIVHTSGDWNAHHCSNSNGALPCFCLGKIK